DRRAGLADAKPPAARERRRKRDCGERKRAPIQHGSHHRYWVDYARKPSNSNETHGRKFSGLSRISLNKPNMLTPRPIVREFFARSVHKVAPDLIGATLLFGGVGGRIVEVEAYHHTDPAAHSYNGRTERNAVMFGPPGYAYEDRSYGIHWCLNFVCEEDGSASAILIRALAPTRGVAVMRRRRGLRDERALCSGP